MTTPRSSRVERGPLVILAVMSVLCFGGPFGVRWVLQGGKQEGWPPDRPVEWVALIGSCVLVLTFMLVLLKINLRLAKTIRDAADRPRAAP